MQVPTSWPWALALLGLSVPFLWVAVKTTRGSGGMLGNGERRMNVAMGTLITGVLLVIAAIAVFISYTHS